MPHCIWKHVTFVDVYIWVSEICDGLETMYVGVLLFEACHIEFYIV